MKHSAVRLDGDVAIVTGAGNGLGRAHALALADRGAAVVCNDVVGSAAEATAHEIVQRGGKALPESSSVASPEGGATIVEAAIAAYGSVQIVVNNAGQLRTAPFDEMRIEDFDDVVRTHLAGAFYVTQPAYRHMKADGYGRIIFTSSNAGAFGIPWQANYAAAKAGVMGLCSVVALEGAAHGIRANAILPVALNTNMQNPSGHALFAPKDLEELGQRHEAAGAVRNRRERRAARRVPRESKLQPDTGSALRRWWSRLEGVHWRHAWLVRRRHGAFDAGGLRREPRRGVRSGRLRNPAVGVRRIPRHRPAHAQLICRRTDARVGACPRINTAGLIKRRDGSPSVLFDQPTQGSCTRRLSSSQSRRIAPPGFAELRLQTLTDVAGRAS